MRPTALLLAVFCLASTSPARAQTAGDLPLALQLPTSTRAMALGDGYMMNAAQADALFYHPALLTEAQGFGLDYQRWGGAGTAAAASAATRWFGGGVGIGLLTLQYGGPAEGLGASPGGQDHLFSDGSVPVSERVAVVGLAREVMGFDVGIAGKLVDERVGMARDAEVMVDLSLSTEVGPLTAAITARDLGRAPLASDDDFEVERVVLGVGAYGQEVGIFDVGFTTALSYSSERTRVSGGLEVGYWPIRGRTFVGRVGLQQVPDGSGASPFTFGFAFWGDELVLEWAYHGFGEIDSGTHRFGVRWR